MRQLKEGDIFMTSRYKSNLYTRIVPPLIRFFTKSEYHHSGVIAMHEGKLMAWESIASGFKPTCTPEELQEKAGKEYDLVVFRQRDFNQIAFDTKMAFIKYAPYDFGSLIVFCLIQALTGVWIGRIGTKSLDRIYCTEACAFVIGMERFWQVNPKHLYTYLKTNTEHILTITNKGK